MTIKATETVPKVLYFFIKRFYTSITFSGTEKKVFLAIMYLIVVTLEKKALLDSVPEKNPLFLSLKIALIQN